MKLDLPLSVKFILMKDMALQSLSLSSTTMIRFPPSKKKKKMNTLLLNTLSDACVKRVENGKRRLSQPIVKWRFFR